MAGAADTESVAVRVVMQDPQLLAQARLKENSLDQEVDFVLVVLLQLPQKNCDYWTEFPVKIPIIQGLSFISQI